ncbi:MAG TPA: class I SAM-dependent methyltransferase [Anaerolineaceae bacterium]|nr:class I SAM-dependent methyltransferase [Anaerolineaceae bacterium]HPN54134.1 class I SAM-dependent methyltransferase [Anaerolineaceae bacterium]
MLEDDLFWDAYWEMRLQPMENLGKREAILAASRLMRSLAMHLNRPLRILEAGCGEGQVIGPLTTAHAALIAWQGAAGVDLNERSLARARADYANCRFVAGDFTREGVQTGLGQADVLLLVNALHEVFSAEVVPESGEVDVPAAKAGVEAALGGLGARCLEAGGWLVLFDGLEPPGDPQARVQIRLADEETQALFEVFIRQYQPFRIQARQLPERGCVELSRRDFARFVDKSIFLGKTLWQTEKMESYQYFTEEEFRAVLARQRFEIHTLSLLTVNEDKWRQRVEILTPGVHFPAEHILITAQRRS